LAVISVALLAGIGLGISALYATFFGDGGAESPESASETFKTAINSKDLVGVVALVEPQEMAGLQDLMASVTAAAKRAGLAKERIEVTGVDIDLTDLTTRVKMESDHVARVTYSGKVKLSWQPSELPSALRTMLTGYERPQQTSTEFDVSEAGVLSTTGIMMNERGDGWYISPSMTVAEAIIHDQGLATADYDALLNNSSTSTGAGSPDDALGELFDAAQTGDPRRVIAALPSDTYGFLRVYEPAIVDAIRRSQPDDEQNFLSNDPITLDDADIATTSAGDDLQRLTVKSANGEYGLDGGDRGTWSYEDFGFETSDSSTTPDPTTNGAVQRVASRFGIEGIPLVARRVDDGWKIDPYRSIFDLGLRLAESIDTDLINTLRRSTDGTPAGTIEPGVPQTVKVGRLGTAIFDMATEDGKIYTVSASPANESSIDESAYPTGFPFPTVSTFNLAGFGGTIGLGDIKQKILAYGQLVVFSGGPGQRISVGDVSAAEGAEFEVTVTEVVTKRYTLGSVATGPELMTFDWPGGELALPGETGAYGYVSLTSDDPLADDAEWSESFNGEALRKGSYTAIVPAGQSLTVDVLKEGFGGGKESITLPRFEQSMFALTEDATVTFTATSDDGTYLDVAILYANNEYGEIIELNDSVGAEETGAVEMDAGRYLISCTGTDRSGSTEPEVPCTITATISR